MRSRRQPVRGIAAQFLLCLCLCALVCVLLSGCGGKRTLPDAGFDYRVSSDGVLLGYPIPRHGANPYLLKSGDNGCAFVYDDAADTYINLPVSFETLVCGENKTISVPSTEYRGRKIYFSFTESTESSVYTVQERAYRDRAAVVCGPRLLLCSPDGYEMICSCLLSVCGISDDRILYLAHIDTKVLLFSYENGVSVPVFGADDITDAWYADTDGVPAVVFRADGVWYLKEENEDPVPAADIPLEETDLLLAVRGTVYALCGNNDTLYVCGLFSGKRYETDMGGILRLDRASDAVGYTVGAHSVSLPLSPDGQYLFLPEYECLYRFCLFDGSYSVILNEAPTFENTCPLSSVTAADGDHLLLSQASAEYTEFVAVLTEGVFLTEKPEQRHETEKIDLDETPSAEE